MSNVFALTRHHKVVGTDGRISGQWVVLLPMKPDGTAWVTPQEVVVWDEGRHSGIVLYGDAFTASVEQGVAKIGRVTEHRRDDIEEVKEELQALLVEIARTAAADVEIERHDS